VTAPIRAAQSRQIDALLSRSPAYVQPTHPHLAPPLLGLSRRNTRVKYQDADFRPADTQVSGTNLSLLVFS
jgi:hypothetical protein